jgi:transglutaminase-like putative cysteine protease
MARAIGLPARIAVGLAYVRGAFYYHAWPEVFLEASPGRGLWVAVDPTLNEYPANAAHLRLVRGGLDRQAAILPLIGHTTIDVVDFDMDASFKPILVGRDAGPPALALPLPQRNGGQASCWSRPQ